jgi:hypothetical protein
VIIPVLDTYPAELTFYPPGIGDITRSQIFSARLLWPTGVIPPVRKPLLGCDVVRKPRSEGLRHNKTRTGKSACATGRQEPGGAKVRGWRVRDVVAFGHGMPCPYCGNVRGNDYCCGAGGALGAGGAGCASGGPGAACDCGVGRRVMLMPRLAFTSTVRWMSIWSRGMEFSPP